MADLSNKQLAKLYPKDSVWVVKTKNGVRTEVIYHGRKVTDARKINDQFESVLVRKAK